MPRRPTYTAIISCEPRLAEEEAAFLGPLMEFGQHEVGLVLLMAGGTEVLADRAEGGTAGIAVFHEPGGLRRARIVSRVGVKAQFGLQRLANRAGLLEAAE